MTIAAVAKKLDISHSYARRLSSTVEQLEKERKSSRDYKARRYANGKCVDCGGRVAYNGKNGVEYSTRCMDCRKLHEHLNRKWSRENVIAAIRRFAEENGRPPKSTEWIKADLEKGYPPRSAVYGFGGDFRSWADAIHAAGFETYKKMTKIDYGLVLDRLNQGWTRKQIAAEQGCSVGGVDLVVKKFRKEGLWTKGVS